MKMDLSLNHSQRLMCHKTNPYTACPVYGGKRSDGECSNAEALGNAGYPFIAIASRFTLTWSGST